MEKMWRKKPEIQGKHQISKLFVENVLQNLWECCTIVIVK